MSVLIPDSVRTTRYGKVVFEVRTGDGAPYAVYLTAAEAVELIKGLMRELPVEVYDEIIQTALWTEG